MRTGENNAYEEENSSHWRKLSRGYFASLRKGGPIWLPAEKNEYLRGSHVIAMRTPAIDLRKDGSSACRIFLAKAQLERRSLLYAVVNRAGLALRLPAFFPAALEKSFQKFDRRYD